MSIFRESLVAADAELLVRLEDGHPPVEVYKGVQPAQKSPMDWGEEAQTIF